MNETKKKYRQKLRRRYVDFYIYESDLYEFSKSINFQKAVKQYLKMLQKGEK